ncbi:MAG: DUF2807 domain-containing protein [Prevotellaceae bacterium]|nr:DUF2807 domain-containing protein [Prevotellaceae bacterium]
MKRFLFTIICAVFLVSCNDEIDLAGRQGIFEFLQDDFSGVGVQDGFELYLTAGNPAKIRIESDENVINHVKYEVKNGILYFYKEPKKEFSSEVSVKIYVTKDSLDALIASSSKVQITDTLRTKAITIVLSNKSALTGRLECTGIQSAINGSTVELEGISDTLRMNIDGGSTVKLSALTSNNADVNISGSSAAEITVNRELEVNARERSRLHYKGTAVIRSLVSDDDSEIKKIP